MAVDAWPNLQDSNRDASSEGSPQIWPRSTPDGLTVPSVHRLFQRQGVVGLFASYDGNIGGSNNLVKSYLQKTSELFKINIGSMARFLYCHDSPSNTS